MDPYDILGVRPNSGRDEIELAYKGLRSQYHADRYAQSDAETQAWATGKMQEVNQAYRVLNEPQARAQFDQRKASAPSNRRRPSVPEPSRDAEAAAPDVASILLKSEWKWSHETCMRVRPIPCPKLDGVISSYAPELTRRDVPVLLDDTVFGGAKEPVENLLKWRNFYEVEVDQTFRRGNPVTTARCSDLPWHHLELKRRPDMSGEKHDKYYSISDAWDDVICGYDAKEKMQAGAKFVGKLGFNTLCFTGGVALAILKEAPSAIANVTERELKNRSDIPEEKRVRMQEYVDKYKSK